MSTVIIKWNPDVLPIAPEQWERVDNKQLLVHKKTKAAYAGFWRKALKLAVLNIGD